jgi:alpha-L-fucosidase
LLVGGIKSKINKAYFLTDKTQRALPREFLNATDIAVAVPRTAPDTSNTVIVLEMKGDIETDQTRFVADNILTRLLAFDAQLNGKGFGFGDGKSNAYFVDGWKSKDQSVSWVFRCFEPAQFRVILKYAASPETEGVSSIKAGDKFFTETITATQKGNEIVIKEIGTINTVAGTNEINISALDIKKTELMKLLEIQLIPIEKKK